MEMRHLLFKSGIGSSHTFEASTIVRDLHDQFNRADRRTGPFGLIRHLQLARAQRWPAGERDETARPHDPHERFELAKRNT
jgi:hypothetical protein